MIYLFIISNRFCGGERNKRSVLFSFFRSLHATCIGCRGIKNSWCFSHKDSLKNINLWICMHILICGIITGKKLFCETETPWKARKKMVAHHNDTKAGFSLKTNLRRASKGSKCMKVKELCRWKTLGVIYFLQLLSVLLFSLGFFLTRSELRTEATPTAHTSAHHGVKRLATNIWLVCEK